MRSLPFGVVVAISVLLGGVASAEKVRTNQTTTLLARPGEQAKHLLTVKSGQNMTLLSQDGRWLKVRVNGRTGYVPRSKVDMADDTGIARNTRRRSFVDGRGKKRGFGGESAPDDRVGADATGETGTADEGDSSDEEDEPKPKKAPAKAAPAKAAASKGKPAEDDEEDEDEEEAPPPKKAAPPPKATPKPTPAKAAAKASQDEDDEEDDEEDADEKPAAKPAPKPAAKAATKPAGKSDDEEDDEEGDSDEEDKPAAKGASSTSDDDEEEDTPIKKKDSGSDREVVHVLKTIKVREKPDTESDDKFVARPTDMLFPKETRDGWTHVENDEGDSGWVESDQLESNGGGAAAGKPAINVGAGVGLTIIQQGMRTSGSNVLEVPDNYNIGTSAGTLSLGGGVLFPRGKALLGAELTYDYAKALGGGVAFDPDGVDGPMPVARIGIVLHNINVRGIAGLDFKKKNGMALLGHLGYRYQGFLVADYADFAKNPARLPSETVKGPTLGAAFVIPRITDKIGIKFSLDAMLFGASVKQTVGLEDGSAPSAKAIVVGTGFTYRLKAIELAAAYNLNYMGIDFGAPVATSMRNHMGTNVTRTDIFHMITFGIAKPF